MLRRCLLAAALFALTPLALAQRIEELDPADSGRVQSPMERMYGNVREILNATRMLSNWDEHYGYVMNAMENVYAENDWTSESDQFSMDMIRAVEANPPWAFQQRFETFMGMLSDRYNLSDDQQANLQRIMQRDSINLYRKHSQRIMEYATEAIATRAAGEPFTPEQVARWSTLAGPVMADAQASFRRSSAEFVATLDPAQQAIAQADIAAAERRFSRIEQMRQQWVGGGWKASDWGLQNDPIQQAGATTPAGSDVAPPVASATPPNARTPRRTPPKTGSPAGRPAPAAPSGSGARPGVATPSGAAKSATSAPSDPWRAYVEAFIAKYKLDDGQQNAAWGIHKSIDEPASRLKTRNAQQLEQLKLRGDADAVRKLEARHAEELDRMFDALKKRLERLPTRAQRREAEAAESSSEKKR